MVLARCYLLVNMISEPFVYDLNEVVLIHLSMTKTTQKLSSEVTLF